MSFFKTPAWAQPQVAKLEDDEGDKDLFSHKSSFLSIFKEQTEREKKQKEKDERRKARREEKRKSSERRKSEEGADKGELKKRRITAEESNELLAKAGLGDNAIDLSDDDDEEPVQQQRSVRRSPRNARVKDALSPRRPKSHLPAPIPFGDESEDDIEITAIKAQAAPPSQPEEEEDSDPDIAELQRQARAKARAKQQQQTKASSSDAAGITDLGSSTPLAPDPVVRILVSSTIPNTTPLILCRKMSQRLREVREMYCKKQGFSDEFSSKVFLVHRGRQYWDSTTVQRLGLAVDKSGRVYRVDDPIKEDVDQVHVEAVTQELFEEMKAEKARQAKVASGVADEEEEEAADEGAAEEAPAPQVVRLYVKAKGKADWKVQVTPTTAIGKIIKAAKKNFGFAEEQNARLEFDGERLEPSEVMGSTEIEDMDCVELYVES